MVVTRFAPSPTGFLHIGGARTALFNFLFARHHRGKFLLRIEDTDKARAKPEAVEKIFAGMKWLGLDWDGDALFQSQNQTRHCKIAHELVARGGAYRCFSSIEEIDLLRKEAQNHPNSAVFRSPWRDAQPPYPSDRPYVIRLKAPQTGATEIHDKVQGKVVWQNKTLDDMVLLRADGTPTYMLAVVVDDHDMGITHIIRGDDHLNNAARQTLLYQALGWDCPAFAHIPLIHGPDGKKLSKRHGALGVENYKAMGFPAAAMCNGLARLGWSHGNDEFFTMAQAIEWFSLDNVGRSPARIDFDKLAHLSKLHINTLAEKDLCKAVDEFLAETNAPALSPAQADRFIAALPFCRKQAKSIPALLAQAHFALIMRPIIADEKAAGALDDEGRKRIAYIYDCLSASASGGWTRDALAGTLNKAAADTGEKFALFAAPLRAALAGRATTPSVFDMMQLLGRTETLARLSDQCPPA